MLSPLHLLLTTLTAVTLLVSGCQLPPQDSPITCSALNSFTNCLVKHYLSIGSPFGYITNDIIDAARNGSKTICQMKCDIKNEAKINQEDQNLSKENQLYKNCAFDFFLKNAKRVQHACVKLPELVTCLLEASNFSRSKTANTIGQYLMIQIIQNQLGVKCSRQKKGVTRELKKQYGSAIEKKSTKQKNII
ncbi:uncharacterized protein LOC131935803 [Physella acuta]|uniref:uncharacterized protein LOC131935803 n=1 Tax=Physella acuta TaxID=109671 RepID=UPI0027DDB7F6|nr:uncharacterized protein LOC131935803 [Physella acuta]